MPNVHPNLWQRYQATRAASTAKCARDITAGMGTSEVELAATRLGRDAVYLNDDTRTLIAALEYVDKTKYICRNEYAARRQVGQFAHQHLGGHVGLVLNLRAFDLCLFLGQWASAFHLNDNGRQSIQFFDHHGDAPLKVYATTQTNVAAWGILIAECRVAAPAPLALRPLEPVKYTDTTDGAALKNDQRAMTDVHRSFGLLRKYQPSCQQIFRLMSNDLACRVDRHTLPPLLETARQGGSKIMVLVGNRGCAQIFIGTLEKPVPMRGWLNIFNITPTLHLYEESLDEMWVTRKPTSSGYVTGVELFTKDDTQITQPYDQRSEGHPRQAQWCQQIGRLTREGPPA